jgi:hypothetical protein
MKTILQAAVLALATYFFSCNTASASDGTEAVKHQKISKVFPAERPLKIVFIKRCGEHTIIRVVKLQHTSTSVSSPILDSEMNKAQQTMSEMDAALIEADKKNKQTAETILQSGINL